MTMMSVNDGHRYGFNSVHSHKTSQGITTKGPWARLKSQPPANNMETQYQLWSLGTTWSIFQKCFMGCRKYLTSVVDGYAWYSSTSNRNHQTSQCTINKDFWVRLKSQPLADDTEVQCHYLKPSNCLINVIEVSCYTFMYVLISG